MRHVSNWAARQALAAERERTIAAYNADPLEFVASEQRARELRRENQRRAMAAGGAA